MWFLDGFITKMIRKLVIFPLSRSSEATVLFTQLPVLTALLAVCVYACVCVFVLENFLDKRFSKQQ